MSSLKALDEIPQHLTKFTLKQDYRLYTPMDQAGWRFIMMLSKDFFKDHAHTKYLDGLPATGISTDAIPRVEDIDRCLQKLGWRAAVVSGFIPPAIFLEFLSLGILPIACDMRTASHLHYTPAPDIVHEAAGHAPILADPEYANYIRRYGEVSQKVIFSAEDLDVYNAIRKLSDIKEDPASTEEDIRQANHELEAAVNANKTVSEATLLSRMAWWTIEYGLVGSLEKPLIYGAGLLSSVAESYDCFAKDVKKIPLTLDCINTSYDITKPQPQLFVTPNFQHLVDVLNDFEKLMAFKVGGEKGLRKALDAHTVTTCEWSNNLQVSGVIDDLLLDSWGRPSFLRWRGYCQLSLNGSEVSDFGPERLNSGLTAITSPLLKGKGASPMNFNATYYGRGSKVQLDFEGGLHLEGEVEDPIVSNNVRLGLLLRNCKIRGGAIGESRQVDWLLLPASDRITSVFGEAADRAAYYKVVPFMHEPKAIQKTNLTPDNKELNELYAKVRKIRDQGVIDKSAMEQLSEIHNELDRKYRSDWLLRFEILELLLHPNVAEVPLSQHLMQELRSIERLVPHHRDLIQRGLALLS